MGGGAIAKARHRWDADRRCQAGVGTRGEDRLRAALFLRPDRDRLRAGFFRRSFARAPFEADRKIIDVSGDGDSNGGRDIQAARDDALAHGVATINGIVILSGMDGPDYLVRHAHPPGGLDGYYRRNVIGGVNAFVRIANGFEDFGRSLVAKLVQEISQRRTGERSARSGDAIRIDHFNVVRRPDAVTSPAFRTIRCLVSARDQSLGQDRRRFFIGPG